MANNNCGKHPNLHQLPGVCSSCLRERLHQLVVSPETATTATANSRLHFMKSPSFSGRSSSALHVPWSLPGGSRRRGQDGRHRRNCSYVAAAEGGSAPLGVRVGGGGLKKSRSMVLGTGKDEEEEEEEEGVKMMKRGFWSKLIRFRSGRSKEKEISCSNTHHRHHHHHNHNHSSSATLREIFMY
ncbi:hypothetical protein CRG98_040181 [Punica granatum]|uniref:Uncharacterized protein n=1 Tax=Punica granatum TaxID=22663 RepID=A0A2I0I6I7_PUNGR|nr:hypothetical protein CRG98_040181 [Punica granatum]